MFWGRLKKNAQGFSFVELAVVLASVTAIIGMVSGGLVMINKSKTNSIIADISNFTNAINQFEKVYYALPGDIASLNALPDAIGTEGNGNGAIDTDEEAINVWYHLSLAGLVDGNYDGNSIFKPGKGIPASSIEGSGYNIKLPKDVTAHNMPSQAIIIELAGFSDTDNNLPIVKPEDAKTLDKKLDNGFPLTGTILAEGFGNQCVNTYSKYNLSYDLASCRVLFVVRSGQSQNDAPQVTGYCNELGQTRRISDFSQNCPTGYVGKVVETCRIDSSNVGSWEITDRICEELKCSSGGNYLDTRRLSCINGMKGTEGIVEQCTESGIWKVIRSDCKYRTDIVCKNDGDTRKPQGCDWGKTGYALQTCSNNKWSAPSPNACNDIVCGIDNIGETNITTDCGANYQGGAVEVCTIAGSWETTSVGSTCSPNYNASSCIAGTTPNKDIGCPPGTDGEHILTCVDAATDYWTTHKDTCKPIKCSGNENIGSVRVKEGSFCPNGTNGTVMEYCRVNPGTGEPEWKEALTNCVLGVCETPNDNLGNAYWPTTVGGSTATYIKCIAGYEKTASNPNSPTRLCNNDGTWSNTVNDECVRKTCPATMLPDGTTYPATIAGESKVQGSCDDANGYFAPDGYPIMDCDINGNWINERVPCIHTCPRYKEVDIGVTGVDMWFDTADECMVFSDESCTVRAIPGTSKVGCIKDKSANEYNATQSTSSFRPSYTSAATGHNNLPTVYFDGIDNALRYPDLGAFTQTTGFLVHNIESFSGNEYEEIISADNEIGGNIWWFYAHNNGDYLSLEVYDREPAETYGGSASLGTYTISTMLDDNSTAASYRNGSVTDSQVITWPQDKIWGPGTIGAWSNGVILYEDHANMNLAELIVYDEALTYRQRQSVESYLGDKWGIENKDVYQSAALWLDATDATTVKRNASCTTTAAAGSHTVGCWMDKSGNDYHATQSTSSFRPSYTSAASGHNNLPTIKFDGSNDRLAFPDLGEFNQTTVFAIHKEDSYPSGGQMIIGPSGWDTRDTFLYFEVAPGERMRFWTEGRDPTYLTLEDYTTAGTYNLTSAYDNNSKTELYRNGNSLVASNISTQESMTWGPGHIGAWENGGFSQFHTGNIGEIILYDQPLSPFEIEVVHTYLIDKWDVKDADIKDSTILWLDGDDPSTLFTNTGCSSAASIGNNIGCWKDKSGNNNNAIQSAMANKPRYTANVMNSKPALDFDRLSHENLHIPDSAGDDFDLIGNFTVMTTMRFDNLGNYWGGILVRGSSYANPFEIGTYKVNDSSRWRLYFDVGDNTWDNTEGVESTFGSITTGTDYVFTFRTSGPSSNHRIYINGEIKGNNTAAATPSNSGQPVYIGSWEENSNEGVDGKIAEILFFPSALSNSSREEVETYLGDKWGITINH